MQVPRHEYRVVEDAGSEKVAIDIHLTGVTDPSSINVVIEPPHIVTVKVPDRYHLQLTLSVPISLHAESVRFKRKTGKLAMLCTVISTTEGPAAAVGHEQLQEDAEAAAAAATGHQQRQEEGTAAEPTRQTAAGAGHDSTPTPLQRQQHQSLTPSGDRQPPAPQQEQQDASAGCQQQQDRQQQAVMLDSDLPQFVQDFEYKIFTRKHDFTLVGCWCAVIDALTNGGVRLGVKLAHCVEGVPRERIPCGFYGHAVLDALWCLGAALAILSIAPTYLWAVAWGLPQFALTAFRVCFMARLCPRMVGATPSEREAFVTAEFIKDRKQLQDNDSLEAALTKVLLVAISATVMWGVVWVTCVWQLGYHSLGGWVLAALLLVWRVVVWLWRLLLWRPPSWYPLQILVAGMYTCMCFDAQFTSRLHTQDGSNALVFLQVIITGGGWATLCSFALSTLWHFGAFSSVSLSNKDGRKETAAEQPAAAQEGKPDQLHSPVSWWPAAAAGMFPTIIRSWLLLLSHWGPSQSALSAVGAGVEAAVVLLAGGLGGTLSLMQAGLQLLSAACRHSLACFVPGPLQRLAGLILATVTARFTGLASRLGWWWVQRAAGAVMGVLTWAAPAWYVGPLVQRACAASGVWQEGCLELLQPYAAQAPDSLSLRHSWWFTVIIQVWVGCILRQLVACRGGEAGGRWLQQERQQRLEAARQRKEQKMHARRQQKKHAH